MVYDLHGNAAEHMNLPLDENQMSSRGSREYGYTEMKGSWFIFDHHRAMKIGASGVHPSGTAARSWTKRVITTTISAFVAASALIG